MTIQIGKYKRPGIFLEEFDKSQITSPTVDGITNLVIGVSKKGPVNTPIRLTNTGDLERIFGQLDRQLERKGSFFHRTISKMLEASPVYAINLLLTDDNLDQLEYQNLSSATSYQNDVERLAPYRRFFDTTGFWKRDTESFINITKSNAGYEQRLLNFTNLSDRYVTIFCFKSKKVGFDRSLLEWYGSIEKMPPYVYPTDLASDYLVDVLVVAGDFSNYKDLSVDPRYSNYFSATGLRKEQVRNFSNDRNVTTLAAVEGVSLIPYFRDGNGANIFIETVINRDTDKHGVFCAFNIDLFETDYPKGLVDLIGNNLVGDSLNVNPPTNDETYYGSLDGSDGSADGEFNVNFLSYKENITETTGFENRSLDRPGNVIALFGTQSMLGPNNHNFKDNLINPNKLGGFLSGYLNDGNRTWWYNEGYVNDVYKTSFTVASQSLSVGYAVDQTSNNGYAVIGGNLVNISGTFSLNLSATSFPVTGITQSYRAAYVLDTTGNVKVVQTVTPNTQPNVASTDIVFGYASFSVCNGNFVGGSMTDVTINSNTGGGELAYIPLSYGTDYIFSTASQAAGSFKVEYLDTNESLNLSKYETARKIKHFNAMLTYINTSSTSKGVMLLDPMVDTVKLSMASIVVKDIVTSTTQNKSFVIATTPNTNNTVNSYVQDDYVENYFLDSSDIQNIVDSGVLAFYKLDDEQLIGKNGVVTKNEIPDAGDIGVAAKYSTLYSKYNDGLINSGDVIYQKTNYSPVQAIFVPGESATASIAGYDYIVFKVSQTDGMQSFNNGYFNEVNNLSGYQFLIKGVSNTGVFTTKVDEGLTPANTGFPYQPTTAGGDALTGRAFQLATASNGVYDFFDNTDYKYFAYEVAQNTSEETLDVLNLFAYSPNFDDAPAYIEVYIDSELNLRMSFKDYLLTAPQPLASIDIAGNGLASNNRIYVSSFDSNYKQAIEIEQPANWIPVANKILVRGSRYTEIKTGDYLEADYDVNSLMPDQMPKKLTRILSKKVWSGDSSLVEITCDATIKVTDFNGDKQTFRYSTFDNYVTTYKAISLKGFRIRQESLPDGTEEKQNDILNLTAKGTPMFHALTNKEAFDFRYLIDGFGLGLTERSKQQLVDICGERLDCFGILNMPSMKQFKNSSSPSFVNEEGVLQLEYVAAGGNIEANPAFLYSFGDGKGVSATGYFTPYVTVNDNGRPVDVPPSAYIGITYMRKHNSTNSNIVPWTIAAGITNGKVTNIAGIEMDFTPQDIEYLNQAQMNPITFKRNRGYMIETENTAQVLYKSALSYIHVREVLIELERELAAMLLDFQWKFNTPEIRAEIKLRADVICEKYVSRQGLFNYFNKCDEENNTQEIIDNQIGVLDTFVEPIRGMGIIVNNVTILRTGSIQSGGFITD
jgi:hypothetical protein